MSQLVWYRLKMAGIDAVKSALIREAAMRRGRSLKEWTESEAKAVWLAARDFAQQNGLRVPELAEVLNVERQASGHSDYASKWALYTVELTFTAEAAAA